MNTRTQCRWGILGTANIARKNWQAILDAGNARLIAVASRDAQKSSAFVSECQATVPHTQAPMALGSYEELIAHPEVDAIYFPLPTGIRKEWVIRAAEAGKHVLVEKPVGVSTNDVTEIIAACDRNRVQFMDGVMFMHNERMRQMLKVLSTDKTIGDIRRITTQFSFHGGAEFLEQNIRTHSDLEPHGCLGDLGWYCIRFTLGAMNWEMPKRVTGRILSQIKQTTAPRSVPTEFSGELFFEKGTSAAFFCSFIAENQQWAVVSGEKGLLRVNDFVLPFKGDHTHYSITQSQFHVEGCQFEMTEGRKEMKVPEPSNNAPRSQEAELFRTFSDLVIKGTLDSHWPHISLQTQTVMDACLQSARENSVLVSL
jgi:predicted dehydrogenase